LLSLPVSLKLTDSIRAVSALLVTILPLRLTVRTLLNLCTATVVITLMSCFVHGMLKIFITTKLAHDGLQVSVHPGCAQGQGQGQRSRDMGTFVLTGKSLLLPRK